MSNTKITYQQARIIRKQSLSSLFADQLIMGEGYGSAAKKTIALKTKAKIYKYKEKFDPLNIIKFMTGGSRLGPALLGKLTGRSRRDIENFAGRAKAVGQREPRIGRLPNVADTSGLSSVLNDIYTFLQKSHERDMISREKENNLREGQKHEDERRHNQLLKALGAKPSSSAAGPVSTATPVNNDNGGGFLNGILSRVMEMIEEFKKSLEWVNLLKPFMRFIGSRLLNFLLSPGMLALAPIAIGALLAMAAKELVEAVGQKQIDTAKDLLERNKNRESLSAEDKVKLDDEIAAAGGMKKLNQIMETANGVPVEQRTVEPRPDTNGGKNAQRAKNWDKKFGATHNPDGTPKLVPNNTNTGNQTDNSMNDAEMKKLQRQNDAVPAAVTEAVSARAEFAKTDPRLVTSEPQIPMSAAVSAKTNENLSLGIQSMAPPATSSTTNHVVNNVKKNVTPKLPIPSVRNHEETFQRLIYQSTRVI
jgi:hypothetical protein